MLTTLPDNFRYSRRRSADIVVIGGGATGVGIARDAALRGFRVILVEKGNLGAGTSSRFHGILHSGGRYAVDDPETARECMEENRILKRVARPAILDTGGLFIALNDEELAYADTFLNACKAADIPTQELSLDEAVKREPFMVKPPLLKRAIATQDGFIDGERLLRLNRRAAEHATTPAQFLVNHQVVGFYKHFGRIEAVIVENHETNQRICIESGYVINAAGVWAGRVSRLAGITIDMVLDKGSMITFEKQLNFGLLHRLRPQSDGDLMITDGNHSIMGTTSVVTDNIDDPQVEPWEIDLLLRQGEMMVPSMAGAEIRKVYAGVRPLFGAGTLDADEHRMTRSFKVLDHADEGIDNFISVVGGKVTVYRLMAERAVDMICTKQARGTASKTAEALLAVI